MITRERQAFNLLVSLWDLFMDLRTRYEISPVDLIRRVDTLLAIERDPSKRRDLAKMKSQVKTLRELPELKDISLETLDFMASVAAISRTKHTPEDVASDVHRGLTFDSSKGAQDMVTLYVDLPRDVRKAFDAVTASEGSSARLRLQEMVMMCVNESRISDVAKAKKPARKKAASKKKAKKSRGK